MVRASLRRVLKTHEVLEVPLLIDPGACLTEVARGIGTPAASAAFTELVQMFVRLAQRLTSPTDLELTLGE